MPKRILIAGQEGIVGSALYRILKNKKNYSIIERKRKDLDFTIQKISRQMIFKK